MNLVLLTKIHFLSTRELFTNNIYGLLVVDVDHTLSFGRDINTYVEYINVTDRFIIVNVLASPSLC